jgi:hypothetical protein
VRHPDRNGDCHGNGNAVGHGDTVPVGLSVGDCDWPGDTCGLANGMPDTHRDAHPDRYGDRDRNAHRDGNGNRDAFGHCDRHPHGDCDRDPMPVRACDIVSPAGRALFQRAVLSAGTGLSRPFCLAARTATL